MRQLRAGGQSHSQSSRQVQPTRSEKEALEIQLHQALNMGTTAGGARSDSDNEAAAGGNFIALFGDALLAQK